MSTCSKIDMLIAKKLTGFVSCWIESSGFVYTYIR